METCHHPPPAPNSMTIDHFLLPQTKVWTWLCTQNWVLASHQSLHLHSKCAQHSCWVLDSRAEARHRLSYNTPPMDREMSFCRQKCLFHNIYGIPEEPRSEQKKGGRVKKSAKYQTMCSHTPPALGPKSFLSVKVQNMKMAHEGRGAGEGTKPHPDSQRQGCLTQHPQQSELTESDCTSYIYSER